MPEYEIFTVRSVWGVPTLQPFTPPLRVGTLEALHLMAPIIRRQFGPVEVLDQNGCRVDIEAIPAARAAAGGPR